MADSSFRQCRSFMQHASCGSLRAGMISPDLNLNEQPPHLPTVPPCPSFTSAQDQCSPSPLPSVHDQDVFKSSRRETQRVIPVECSVSVLAGVQVCDFRLRPALLLTRQFLQLYAFTQHSYRRPRVL